ncbi:MAG: NUDIX domain-containing protein [Bacteroidota bacterium]
MKVNNSTRVTTESQSFAITADCAIFGYSEDALRVLLVKRAIAPFAGEWVLPGGAMSDKETLEQTAERLLRELVDVENIPIHQVGTYSTPDRHPVRRVVTTSFFALVRPEDHAPSAKNYLDDAKWCPLEEVPTLGFDHNLLLEEAYEALRERLQSSPLAFQLLPATFTLKEAQQVYESILGGLLDRRNFRRKILAYDFLINTEEKKAGVRGGPELYRIDDAKLENHLT